MKKLLKIVPAYLVLTVGSLFANTQEIQDLEITQPIENAFPYISVGGEARVGIPFVLPALGIGYRMQKNHHGLDSSISFSPLLGGSGNKIEADFIYNYFFIPNLSSQLYTGVGLGVFGLFDGITPELLPLPLPKFVLGKQYENGFLEIQVDPGCFIFPGIVFKCGIGF